jgi:hypothetical protein
LDFLLFLTPSNNNRKIFKFSKKIKILQKKKISFDFFANLQIDIVGLMFNVGSYCVSLRFLFVVGV